MPKADAVALLQLMSGASLVVGLLLIIVACVKYLQNRK